MIVKNSLERFLLVFVLDFIVWFGMSELLNQVFKLMHLLLHSLKVPPCCFLQGSLQHVIAHIVIKLIFLSYAFF